MIELIRNDLRNMVDQKYKDFQSKLMPTVSSKAIMGVRTPQLRKYARNLQLDVGEQFLDNLPHLFYEENNLHAFLIENIKDFDACVERLDAFLPYVDNWATCDGMKPKCFAKNKPSLKNTILRWLQSEHEYTVRYGILMLMTHFLDQDFSEDCLELVAAVDRQEYYIRMMVAWYFATALAKQWDSAIVYLQKNRLGPWVHNKTIQKAIESYRILPEQKGYLRSLRV